MRNEVRKQIALAISFFGAAVLVSFPPALRAQNPGGSLLVTVQDSTGARVAGASVSLTQEKFAISRTGKADALAAAPSLSRPRSILGFADLAQYFFAAAEQAFRGAAALDP